MISTHIGRVKARSTVRVERKRWIVQHFSDGQKASKADNRGEAQKRARCTSLVTHSDAVKHEWGRR